MKRKPSVRTAEFGSTKAVVATAVESVEALNEINPNASFVDKTRNAASVMFFIFLMVAGLFVSFFVLAYLVLKLIS